MYGRLLDRIDDVEALMAERLHLRGRLPGMLAAARGRLPRAALRQARELVDARARLASPATARHLDPGRVTQTCAMLERHLHAVPEGKYRRRAWSALIGTIAMRLLIVAVSLIALAIWVGAR